MKFIEDYCNTFYTNSYLNSVSIAELYNSTSIYIVPMVNPDGVDLVNKVYSKSSLPFIKAQEISNNFPGIPFPDGWKSNINGVVFFYLQLYNIIKKEAVLFNYFFLFFILYTYLTFCIL